jgi:hypothetical protein|tara:strand:- start:2797 stop:4326 length:1530 start_codon:yes stop_codon:yes gene_type:complete
MGAYENPITVIDRESGQIWANAIAGVGQQTVKYIEKQAAKESAEQKAMQKQLAEEADYVLNNQAAFSRAMSQSGVNNPKLFEAGKLLIDDMARASSKVKSAKTQKDRQNAMNEASTLQRYYSNLTQGIKLGGDADKTYQQDRINTGQKGWKKPGDQGGMSVTGKETYAYIQQMNTRNALNKGAVEDYVRAGDGRWNLRYSGGTYGDKAVEVDMLGSLEFDPGTVPDAKNRIMEAFTTESGTRKDGTTFAILNKDNKYTEEYLDFGNTFEEKGELSSDGSYSSSTIAPANTSLIVSASIGKINAVSESYLSDYNEANKVWMEVLNNEEPLKRASGGNVSSEDTVKFKEEMLKYGQSMLPSFQIIDQKENIDYGKRLSTRISRAEKTEGTKKDKAQAVKEVAKELVADLVEDPEAFLTRHMQKENFDMTQGPGAKGFSVIEVDNKGNESRYTYDLTNPSDIERFFRLEIDLGTKAEETKILNEINKIAGVSKANTQTSELSAKDLLTKYSN